MPTLTRLLLTAVLSFFLCLPAFAAKEMVFVKGERSASDLEQDIHRKGQQVLELVDLKPGMVVADVLGGGGYYSELIAEKIAPYGRVYLHNNRAYLPHVGKEVAARLKDSRLDNVIRHDRETGDLAFIDQSLDMIFFVLGYHDMYHVDKNWKIDKDDFIRQLKTALKPGGQLLIIDHSAPDGSGTKYSQDLHRIDKLYVKAELKQKGFKLLKESNLLVNDQDSREISPFHPDIRRRTDRFILLFQK
ncbi:class I SAM-dependent methyltransferase [Thalassomonas haliotis]|uniref:Class I SAM-dependent methyltransferase n=1 Tax=Thalassomonas haliotis TaxID=485448 RepID=A0ABY7V987_9GAMM|nr:class I SAM-dependent methyltransferase [Thalassomonas haliotis]WDE10205.1 class I SAM-dependent methyltransferase [Thalassomonas haliotis]